MNANIIYFYFNFITNAQNVFSELSYVHIICLMRETFQTISQINKTKLLMGNESAIWLLVRELNILNYFIIINNA